jgi:hypothetical protein
MKIDGGGVRKGSGVMDRIADDWRCGLQSLGGQSRWRMRSRQQKHSEQHAKGRVRGSGDLPAHWSISLCSCVSHGYTHNSLLLFLELKM